MYGVEGDDANKAGELEMREADFDRFRVEESQRELYLAVEADETFPLSNHGPLLLLAACVGYTYNERAKLQKPKELVLKSVFLNCDGAETAYSAFKFVAGKEQFVDESGNLKVNTLIEEYAKAGFDKLYNEILSEPGPKANALLNHMMLHLSLR